MLGVSLCLPVGRSVGRSVGRYEKERGRETLPERVSDSQHTHTHHTDTHTGVLAAGTNTIAIWLEGSLVRGGEIDVHVSNLSTFGLLPCR